MKIQFKHKEYQETAVEDVVDCFAGQPRPYRQPDKGRKSCRSAYAARAKQCSKFRTRIRKQCGF